MSPFSETILLSPPPPPPINVSSESNGSRRIPNAERRGRDGCNVSKMQMPPPPQKKKREKSILNAVVCLMVVLFKVKRDVNNDNNISTQL